MHDDLRPDAADNRARLLDPLWVGEHVADAVHDALYGLVQVSAADRGVELVEAGAQLRGPRIVRAPLSGEHVDESPVVLRGSSPAR
ncbi:MAG: hypothetical protein JOZ95_21860 [Solirubrobacterales bacterium]|nr:hypothetical protein [Solirubrobacterales bacterium]